MPVLAYFPHPLPDELFHSICGRFADHMGLTQPQQISRWLFGTHLIALVAGFPSHINRLIEQLPISYGYTVDDMITKHTLLPIFGPFLTQNRYNQVYTAMSRESENQTYRLLGLGSSGIPLLKWLRYCPMCVESDRKKYGECYWHRLHQIPGVEICPEHLVFLEDSQVYSRKLDNLFCSAETTILGAEPRSSLSDPDHAVLHRLTDDMRILLRDCFGHLDHNELQWRYLVLLDQKRFLTTAGKIRNEAFLSQFTQYYSPRLLYRLHCETEETRRAISSWPARLVRRALLELQHPLHHLLLIHFLGRTAREFFQMMMAEESPFGTGPWPCLNPVCKHYKTFSITQCNVVRMSQRAPVGQFTCECGFTYSRSGPDRSDSDIYKIGRVLERGELWKTTLRDLFQDPTFPYRQAASKLGVTPTSMRRILSLYYPELQETRLSPDFLEIRQYYRKEWLEAIAEFPLTKVTQLGQTKPQVYQWLLSNDYGWLQRYKPSVKIKRPTSSTTKLRPLRPIHPAVDWPLRDEETVKLVIDIAEKLRRSTQKPQRITKGAIFREGKIACLVNEKALAKMPLAKQALAEVLETRLDFTLRRIRWVVQQYKSKGISPERWQIIRGASLKEKALQEPLIQAALEEALSEFASSRA
jgi:hypothetical protein